MQQEIVCNQSDVFVSSHGHIATFQTPLETETVKSNKSFFCFLENEKARPHVMSLMSSRAAASPPQCQSIMASTDPQHSRATK